MAGALVLAVTACAGGDDGARGGSVPTSIAVPDGIARSTTTTATTGEQPSADDPTTDGNGTGKVERTSPPGADPGDRVLVEADGLAGHQLGSSEASVVGALEAVLGEPGRTEPVACPGGSDRIIWWDDELGAVFSEDHLTGWTLRAAPDASGDEPSDGPAADPSSGPVIVTIEGIGIGATVAELQAAFPRNFQWVPDSTLGIEFYIGTGYPYLGGLASGQQADDTIDHLWAGDSCSFR